MVSSSALRQPGGGQAGAGDQNRAGECGAAGHTDQPRHHRTGTAVQCTAVVVRGLTAADRAASR